MAVKSFVMDAKYRLGCFVKSVDADDLTTSAANVSEAAVLICAQ